MNNITHLENLVFEVPKLVDKDRCNQLIQHAENLGFDDALITTDDGQQRIEEIRNNNRVITDDLGLMNEIWSLIKPHIPSEYEGRSLVGLNERLRFYRYDPGQKFDWHQDGYFERDNGERSMFTFMIYLNEGFEGGGTTFSDVFYKRYAGKPFTDFTVIPKIGSALLFYHPVSHRGDELIKGRKYVLRTDVMYEKKS